MNWRRDTIAVSMSCYSFKRRLVLTVRRSRQTWRMILMKRRWTISIKTMRGNFTGGWCLRTMM